MGRDELDLGTLGCLEVVLHRAWLATVTLKARGIIDARSLLQDEEILADLRAHLARIERHGKNLTRPVMPPERAAIREFGDDGVKPASPEKVADAIGLVFGGVTPRATTPGHLSLVPTHEPPGAA